MTDTKPQLNYVFDDFADMFVELGAFGTPSELHGLLTGQLAAGVRADAEAWLAMVVAHLDVQAIEDDDDKAELVVLYDMVLEQLQKQILDCNSYCPRMMPSLQAEQNPWGHGALDF